MNKIVKLLLATFCCVSLVGCGNKDESDTVRLNGSTSMEKVVNVLAEAYMEEHDNITVEAQFTGSGTGIEAVIKGTSDIGDSSRSLKDTEKTQGVVENIIAIDGIAVIVSNENTVTNLTKQQLIDIYTGIITNWSEVGGENQPIVVIGRNRSS